MLLTVCQAACEWLLAVHDNLMKPSISSLPEFISEQHDLAVIWLGAIPLTKSVSIPLKMLSRLNTDTHCHYGYRENLTFWWNMHSDVLMSLSVCFFSPFLLLSALFWWSIGQTSTGVGSLILPRWLHTHTHTSPTECMCVFCHVFFLRSLFFVEVASLFLSGTHGGCFIAFMH